MRIITILLFFLFSINLFAQLDTEHWFAPMYDGQSNSGSYQYLYLSTNDTTPFTINIYSNNILIAQTIISKGNPQFVFIPRKYIILNGSDTDKLLTPINMGLYIKGERRFFANLRIGMINHAEILTSKGVAGLGKEFYAVMAPNTQTNDVLGSSVSFIATEDNTTVTLSNFKKKIFFGGLGDPPSITFTLNKGQSYIADIRTIDALENRDGLIGAKITADKPISMTNGNFNGQYAAGLTTINAGSDILMDQSVPIENLGNEFGIISGMGTIIGTGDDITNKGMERVMIVATKNNTEIYLNGSISAVKTINEGDYYFIPDTYYSKKSTDHYNLYIKTSENVYIYQMLGGVSGRIETGSMNFIPPLSCYLPRKIDEIGNVDKLDPTDDKSILTVKLNIITQKGAKININGNYLDPAFGFGPYSLDGNNDWETYSVPNVKGNITVQSDKAVNAGLAGGDGNAVGYAGYFAGFSSIPFIVKKEGICIPDIILELPEGYDYYQWFVKNELTGMYDPISGATAYLFRPNKPGFYIAEVQQGFCHKVTTPEFKLLNCTTLSASKFDICDNPISISPKLTKSSQLTDWDTINIIQNPTKGNINIDKINRTFIYTPILDISGVDTFKYGFCGISTLPDCEEVEVTVNINNIIANDAIVKGCKIDNTKGEFDLTTANVTTDPSVKQIYYYKFQNDADNDTGLNQIPAAQIKNYQSEEDYVYLRLKNFMCSKTVKIKLEFFPFAELVTDTYEECDSKLQDKIDVELDRITSILLKNYLYFKNVKYYNNISATGNSLPNNWSYSSDTVIYMKVESPDDCQPIIFPITFKIGAKVNTLKDADTKEICDEDFDAIKLVEKLDDYKTLFTNDSTVTAKFYINKIDAQNNFNNNINEVTVNKQQTIYIRLFKAGVCDKLVTLNIKIKIPRKSDLLMDQSICPEKTTTLDAGPGFYYDWYNEKDPSLSLGKKQTLENVGIGDYFVILTSFNSCTYTQKVKVTPLELPEIIEILIQNNTVTIRVEKGNPPYLYSLDGINYQSSNIFTNVSPGYHKIYVKSKDDCAPDIEKFTIIEIYNVLTPNDDGYNDVLDMSLLTTKIDVKFSIHDRNGIKVFEGDMNNKYIWDGKLKGRSLPTTSYWYILQWKDFDYSVPVKYTGWILLKNRN